MRKTIILSAIVAATLYLSNGASAADAPALKCPVSGKAASKDHASAYKDGQVYFCCDKCPGAFKADTAKYATKANIQLVASGQYKQAKCPLSGEDVNPKAMIKVAGVKVEFCCDNCKGKVADAKKKEKVNLVFSDEAFKKGFVKATADEKK